MTVHLLKTWADPFGEIDAGRKTAEFRSTADRDFVEGDLLGLESFDDLIGRYNDETIWRVVTHVLKGPAFGIPKGFALVSFRTIEDAKTISITASDSDLGVMVEAMWNGFPDEHYRAGSRDRDDSPDRFGR